MNFQQEHSTPRLPTNNDIMMYKKTSDPGMKLIDNLTDLTETIVTFFSKKKRNYIIIQYKKNY